MPPPKICPLVPDIRWPNDLLVADSAKGGRARKFCGILTEMHAEPDRMHYAVVGIGINVNQTKMPPDLADIATSLRIETGKSHSRFELLIRLLRHFDRYYNQFLADGAQPILRRFAEVSSYFEGKRVRITTATETFTGTTAGLEPSGVLRVARDDGRGIEPCFRATWRRPTDASDARCGQHEHGAGRLPRQGTGRQLAADHRARSDHRRIRHPDARSFHAWRNSSRAKSAASSSARSCLR